MSDEYIEACPECDETRLYERTSMRILVAEPPWRCNDCGATFDEPVRRPHKIGGRQRVYETDGGEDER